MGLETELCPQNAAWPFVSRLPLWGSVFSSRNGDKDTYLDSYRAEWQSISLTIACASTEHLIDAGIDAAAADSDNSGEGDGGAGWVSMGLFLSFQYFEVHDASLWLGSSTQTQ